MAKDTGPQTVTQFAVEQGTVDGSDPAVKATVRAEEERAKAGTARAERVHDMLTPQAAAEEDSGE